MSRYPKNYKATEPRVVDKIDEDEAESTSIARVETSALQEISKAEIDVQIATAKRPCGCQSRLAVGFPHESEVIRMIEHELIEKISKVEGEWIVVSRINAATGKTICGECFEETLPEEDKDNFGFCDACIAEARAEERMEKPYDFEPAGFNGGDRSND